MRFKSEGNGGVEGRHHPLRWAEYDPQPFHLDEEAAKKVDTWGGLAASGWHTAAIAMRLAARCRPFGPHPLFGAGVDDLRWLKPVRPGDTIHLEGEVVELVPPRHQAAWRRAHPMDRLQSRAARPSTPSIPIAIVPSSSKVGRRGRTAGRSGSTGYSKGWVAVFLDGDAHEISFMATSHTPCHARSIGPASTFRSA